MTCQTFGNSSTLLTSNYKRKWYSVLLIYSSTISGHVEDTTLPCHLANVQMWHLATSDFRAFSQQQITKHPVDSCAVHNKLLLTKKWQQCKSENIANSAIAKWSEWMNSQLWHCWLGVHSVCETCHSLDTYGEHQLCNGCVCVVFYLLRIRSSSFCALLLLMVLFTSRFAIRVKWPM